MAVFQKNILLNIFKGILKATVYKPGSTATILRGQLKGYKFIINDMWSPIYGGWEPFALKIYPKFVKPGHVVYDLGAGCGINSLSFCKLVGSTGKVFAFEPLPENVKALEALSALNKLKNLYVINKAISNISGVASFNIGKDKLSGSLVCSGSETGATIGVDVATLDELIGDGLDPADFIKIDIEGVESQALEGFSKSLKKSYPAFVIELHTPEQDVKVGRFFEEYGYKLYRLNNVVAVRVNKQRQPLVEIPNMDSGWPDPDGVWGTIVAVHAYRQNKYT